MIEAIAPASEVVQTATEWDSVTLADGLIENLQTGFACGNHNQSGSGIVHVRPYNVTTDGKMDFGTLKFIPSSEAKTPERLLQRDDVVFNNTNSPELVGKTALYTDTDSRAFSNHMTRLRVNREKVRPRYLALALHQLWREGYFADKCNNHVSQASIGRSVLLETEIPLPSVGEQDRLIEAVDALEVRVKTAREHLHGVPGLIKNFRQSVLAAACSGQLTSDWRAVNDEPSGGVNLVENCQARAESTLGKKAVRVELELDLELPDLPDSWMWAPLGNVTLKVGDVDHRMPKQQDGGIPYISTKDFTQRGISFDRAKRISQADFDQLSKKIRPNRGDVLISRYGTVGEVRLVETDQPHQVSYSVAIVNCHELEYLSRWLAFALSSPTPQDFMRKHTRATSQPDLGLQHIRIIPVPIAPKHEQVEIMRRVESLFALADSIETRLADATAQVERTTQAILAKAFRGELLTDVHASNRL